MYDVIIIGAGVSGCAIARELSRYRLSILVLEKEDDVCEGTTKANSGIVHAGFDAKPGTLKARLNVRGSKLMQELSEKLDFAYKNNGAMVLCFEEAQMDDLRELYDRGIQNGVEGLKLLTEDEVHALEPSIGKVAGALLAETSGIVCPFEMNIAFAENAFANGALFRFGTEVKDIVKNDDETFDVIVSGEKEDVIKGHIVINAAGVYADAIHNMVSDKKMTIIPRRGEYYLMDKETGSLVSRTIFQLPTKLGKGVLVTPTVHGNLMVGPSAEDIEDKEDTATTRYGLDLVKERAALSVDKIPFNKTITNFSGLRATGESGDFEIGYVCPGFIDVAGIESPGLSSAPAIGEYVAQLIGEKYELVSKDSFIDERKGVVHFAALSVDEQNTLIKENPSYGNIVCRCESVTEGEILDAIKRPLGAKTLDGVKRRTRAGMGRCQAGFCTPKVMTLISKELGTPLAEVKKN
ncbi:MAG: NAD(P)/FAD-dependent oxidoreductase [Eubacterium sp.]|nr:NAD(P)/FAD-dependent oxidoreductase [Eubacterium sp.]